MGRRLLPAALTISVALGAGPASGGDPPRVGVFSVGDDAETQAARAGLADALRLGGLAAATAERTSPAGDAAATEALRELQHEGVQVVVAVGPAASRLAQASVRDRFVVCTAVDDADVAGLRLGGNACVAAGPQPATALAELRLAGLALQHVGVYVPPGGGGAREFAGALAADGTDVVPVGATEAVSIDPAHAVAYVPDGATPDARAAAAAARLPARSEALWLPPSVDAAEADALARALEGRGIPLIGSRRAHLDAGCAIVVRGDARDLGAFAAVFARQLLAGADAGKLAVRRTARLLVELNLPAAKRSEYRVPLRLVARADTVVRPKAVPR